MPTKNALSHASGTAMGSSASVKSLVKQLQKNPPVRASVLMSGPDRSPNAWGHYVEDRMKHFGSR